MRLLFALALLAAAPAFAQSADPAVPAARSSIVGVVTDAATGLPVVGAGVVIPDLGVGAVSQRDGRFEIADVPAGTHVVRAGAYTYHFETAEVAVAAGPATVDVALRPGAGVGCAVVHEHGEDGSHMDPAPSGGDH